MCVCIQTYIYTLIHTYIHTHIHTYIQTYIHTHTHTYIHAYTYIHTHTHTYIYTFRAGLKPFEQLIPIGPRAKFYRPWCKLTGNLGRPKLSKIGPRTA